MRPVFILPTIIFLSLCCFCTVAQKQPHYKGIYSGVPWLDDKGNVVSAHGANIVKEKNRYYLFGECHTDTSNAFAGFNCYSSADLNNWKWESIALPQQDTGKLGPNRVGERSKVMRCPATGEFVMYMHVDTLGYKDPFTGYATAKNITGPYHFKGPLLFNGKPIRKWDMGTFQDTDGSGYILLHGGDIYKLSEDYHSIIEQTNKAMERGFEAPTLFRKDSLYYFIGSDLTGWERNDNYYFTSPLLKGPWIKRGFVAPAGTLTWNSQTTFVLPIQTTKGTVYMYMGDRWSYPKQASAATYVWQPLAFAGDSISISNYYEGWGLNAATGLAKTLPVGDNLISATSNDIQWSGQWKEDAHSLKSSDRKGDFFSLKIQGAQIAIYALARPDGGYATIVLKNRKGETVCSATIDTYSKKPVSELRFISPVLPKDQYTLTVSVLGENWYWVEKSGRRSGSKGYFVSLDKILVQP